MLILRAISADSRGRGVHAVYVRQVAGEVAENLLWQVRQDNFLLFSAVAVSRSRLHPLSSAGALSALLHSQNFLDISSAAGILKIHSWRIPML